MLIAVLPYFVLLPHSSSVLSPFLSFCFLPPLCQSPPLFIPPSSFLWLQSISVFPPSVHPLLPAPFLTSLIFIPPIQLLFITSSVLNLDHFFLFCISFLPFFFPSSPPSPLQRFIFCPLLVLSIMAPLFPSLLHLSFLFPVLAHKDWPPHTELPFLCETICHQVS